MVPPKKFQSTHPCGVRHRCVLQKIHLSTSFNPRTPAGCDDEWQSACPASLAVSIHAPLRGATADRVDNVLERNVSIHAPLRGATPMSAAWYKAKCWFQSTHPCGVRRKRYLFLWTKTCFNPRTPAGCDTNGLVWWRVGPVSIHAPLRGATIL